MYYVFLDTEFSDFIDMELLSIGLVSEDGTQEFYAEVNDSPPESRSAFVKTVVMPLMEPAKYAMSYVQVASRVVEWLNNLPCDKITIIVDYAGDMTLITELFKCVGDPTKQIVFRYLHNEFEEMLEYRLISSDMVRKQARRLVDIAMLQYYTVDPRQHHALVDAKANRHGWVEAYKWATKQ